MSEFIKVTRKRRFPIPLAMAQAKTEAEWREEEVKHHVKISDIVSVTHEYDDFFQVIVSHPPLTADENEIFKLVSDDPRLVDLISPE